MNREEEMRKIKEFVNGLSGEDIDVILEKVKKLLKEVDA